MSGKDQYWNWSKGEKPPVARDHTQARVTLTGDYVTRYVEIHCCPTKKEESRA